MFLVLKTNFRVVLLIIILLICILVQFKSQHDTETPASTTGSSSQQQKAKAGILWLTKYPTNFNDPGISWILSEIGARYCPSHTDLQKFAKDSFTSFLSHPFESAYVRLLDKTKGQSIPEPDLRYRQQYFDDILIPALYCTEQEVSTSTLNRIEFLSQRGGYESTHAYLALTWMYKNNCSTQALEELRLQTAQLFAQEQAEEEVFGDLYAERTAFLLYGGHEAFVQQGWIDTIMQNASTSGGWVTMQGSFFFGEKENPHTTALATWALTQDLEGCPLE